MSTLRTPGSSAVPALPGATKTLLTRGRLRDFPREGVLATAARQDQNFMAGQGWLWLTISV